MLSTGVVARGDARKLFMGGTDAVWDHAAGVLIAQESGLLVTNGKGTPVNIHAQVIPTRMHNMFSCWKLSHVMQHWADACNIDYALLLNLQSQAHRLQ